MRRRVDLAPVMQNRRGATMVMVAMFMVVLVGFVGVGIDFARMYAFKAQLQTVADASAMAGVHELLRERPPAAAISVATNFVPNNKVEGANTATSSVVEVGEWTFPSGPFNAASTTKNAVKVTANYAAAFTFGRIFGYETAGLSAVGVAALGSAGSSSCLKPWAISYKALLSSIGHDPNDTAYKLTPADVENLRTNKAPLVFKTSPPGDKDAGSGTAVTGSISLPGNFYAVQFPQDYLASGAPQPYGKPDPGADNYGDAIASNCAIAHPINVGDWLLTQTGNMNKKTELNTKKLCSTITNNVEMIGAEQFDGCDLPSGVTVQMAIYGAEEDKGGGSMDVQVKYIGEFAITAIGNKGGVRGYLTALSPSQAGGFVGAPGPVAKGALVD